MTCLLLLTSYFLKRSSACKSLMNSTDSYAIKKTSSVFESTKKIMHIDNALFIDMLMLCDRKLNDVTNHTAWDSKISKVIWKSYFKNNLWKTCERDYAWLC